MYMGVKNHHVLPRVTSYEGACKALEIWNSKPRRGRQVTQVRALTSDAIAFRLYETDVVIWFPDNTVDVDNYGTTTTSGFASRFLPAGIHLHYPVERRGASGGHKTIGFRGPGERGWERVCQGDVVRFVEGDGMWVPDEDTCDPIKLPVGVDRKAIRELATRYHLREFETWLEVAPAHIGDIHHVEWDLDECTDALEKRDFLQAAKFLPLVKEPQGFGTAERMRPLPISVWGNDHHVTMGSLAKLKLAMWDDAGLLITEERRVWARRDYDRGMARVREMDALGLSVHGMGPV